MAWYIDGYALYKEIERIYNEHYSESSYQFIHDFFRAILRRIRREPIVDAVPVVRCKDCRFIIDRADGTHGCYRHFVDDCNHDDFCSYGERRTDG